VSCPSSQLRCSTEQSRWKLASVTPLGKLPPTPSSRPKRTSSSVSPLCPHGMAAVRVPNHAARARAGARARGGGPLHGGGDERRKVVPHGAQPRRGHHVM